MKINLETGVNIQICGELGKYHTLPIDSLVEIAQNFQALISSIAITDLPSDQHLYKDNFKLELSGFFSGSAVAQFIYSPRAEEKSGFLTKEQREIVTKRLDQLLEISNGGDYSEMLKMYPDPVKRTPIVEKLYTFANGFKNSPVKIVEKGSESFTPIYTVTKFKSAVKDALVVKMPALQEDPAKCNEAVARIKITNKKGRTRNTIMDIYPQDNYSIEYAPTIIVSGDNKYILQHPLRCLFEKEADYYVIHSEMLDIIASGNSKEQAEGVFGDEFEYVYEKLNSLADSQLTKHNQLIKSMINKLVKKIER